MRSSLALRALAITISLVVGVACGGGAGTPAAVTSPTTGASAASTAPTPTSAPVKVRAAYGNVTPANLAPFYAKEKGLFLQNGLDVDLTLIDGGGKAMAALLGNSRKNSISLGTLYGARFAAQCLVSSSAVASAPGRSGPESRGYAITGHHELLLPLVAAALAAGWPGKLWPGKR